MRRLLIKNAKALLGTHAADVQRVAGSDMATLPAIEDGWLLAEDGVIRDMGGMDRR
jgi:imidazolonepropionase